MFFVSCKQLLMPGDFKWQVTTLHRQCHTEWKLEWRWRFDESHQLDSHLSVQCMHADGQDHQAVLVTWTAGKCDGKSDVSWPATWKFMLCDKKFFQLISMLLENWTFLHIVNYVVIIFYFSLTRLPCCPYDVCMMTVDWCEHMKIMGNHL